MSSDVFADVASAVAAAAAATALWYARGSARAGRSTVEAARRTIQIAEASRRSAERAAIRARVERVGTLVQQIVDVSIVESGRDELSPAARGRCQVLGQSIVGLKKLLPRSAALVHTATTGDLQSRAADAQVEIDGVLERLARRPAAGRRGRPWAPGSGVGQKVRRP